MHALIGMYTFLFKTQGCTLYALAFGRSPFEHPRDGVLKLGIISGR
jgi:hypothetical protein